MTRRWAPRDDVERIRTVRESAFRETCVIVSASEPTETVALVNVQSFGYEPPPGRAVTETNHEKPGKPRDVERAGLGFNERSSVATTPR